MKLTSEQIDKFRKLYKSRFGIDLSDPEIREETIILLILMKAILKPVVKQETENIKTTLSDP